MFGEGPLQVTLAQRLAASGHDNRIQLCGFTPDIAYWMRAATLCVSVSDFEGHPNVVHEAASLGCPLLLSDIPAHRELLGDGDAAFVEARDAEVIAQALLRILDQPAAARRRADRALQTMSRFKLEHIAQAYMDTYREVLAARRH
jgi:glycosyltransferase involved in cell wall biosynthesis